MFRAVGISARPMVAVSERLFDRLAPVDSSVQAFVVAVSTEDGPAYVHPSTGLVHPTGDWAERVLLSMADGKAAEPIRLIDPEGATGNGIMVRGEVKIDQEGKVAGQLRIRLSGRFAPFEQLREADAEKKTAGKVLSHVLEGFTVSKVASAELLPGRFLAEVEIASSEALPKVNGQFLLTLAKEPFFTEQMALPLARSERQSAVHLGSPFAEDIYLVVEYPESWPTRVVPIGVPVASGQWGSLEQGITNEAGKLIIQRDLSFKVRDIGPRDFEEVRQAMNLLRSDAARRFLVGPAEE